MSAGLQATIAGMLLDELASTSRAVAATSGRNAKVERLAALLARLAPEEIEIGVSYLMGRVPQGRIGVGHRTLYELSPAPSGPLATAAPAGGPSGPVATAAAPTLELRAVDGCLARLARVSGSGAAAARRDLLGSLLRAATGAERDFLARLLAGELRQGALEGVMVEAIARAAHAAPAEVRRAVMLAGDAARVARVALTEGAPGLARFRLTLFEPVQPMLAQSAEGVADALGRLGRTQLELKLDGARVQIHKSGRDVRVFTRKLNDVTSAVPEIVERVRALPARALILDGEAIALRPDGAPLPFQETMRRFGRRLEVERLRAELPLSALCFDCLHADGEDLIDRPGEERFAALADSAPQEAVIARLLTQDPAEAEAFLAAALARGHEGVMAKDPRAPYEAGRRGGSWLKIKPAHTLDLVVLAAEWGSGRRRGWLSNLHLGARDPAGGFVMLGKTFKGLTDEMLAWQTARLLELEVARDAWAVQVRPELVVEIAFNDVQRSPHYPGGVALRFARVKRYRPDKLPAAADTIDTVRALAPSLT
jgi:DNA ligase-1